jgi:glycosyltransferase involved in cell wall biosynthesis/ubiquinone/menaquinone biosynthesis C-methylase UbiE
MRITVLTSSYPRFPGDGTAPFVQSICEQLAQQGHDVDVVAPDDPDVRPMPTKGVRLHRFGYIWPRRWQIMGHARSLNPQGVLRPGAYLLLPFFLLAAFIQTMRVARRQRVEIIHVHWVLPNGPVAAFVAKLLRIPFVVSLHGSDIYVAHRKRLFGAVAGWVFRQAAAVTACSSELREAAIALGAPEQRTYLLPWGADPAIFQPRAQGKEQETVTIAALGRMVPKKGFDRLLEAWAEIAKQFPQARLRIGGDGPLLETLRNEAKRLGIDGQTDLPGRIPWDHAPDFLAAADLFALPSIRDRAGNIDGLPTVLLEAMSSGLPVVASDLGGIPLVVEDGANGYLIPPGDVDALAQRLRRLLRNKQERERLGKAARTSVVESFNWSNVARRLTKIFADVQATAKPSRERKADKIEAILREFLEEDLSALTCLDVGCADGAILGHLGECLGFNIGIDRAWDSILRAASTHRSAETHFSLADGKHLPFPRDHFDIVLCAQVYEHIPNPEKMVAEIERVLKPGGMVFFSGPNRFRLIEDHYHLPLLSLLPQRLADPYLRVFRKITEYDINPLFYRQLRRLWAGFELHDFTPRMIQQPRRYAIEDKLAPLPWLQTLPGWLLEMFKPLYPNYNWNLVKPKTIPPEAYIRDYFLNACEGHDEFARGRGELTRRLAYLLELASPQAGERALDVGCGRGELALGCSRRGAITWGCDYAPAALRLAKSMDVSPELRLGFQQSEAQALPLASDSFDLVIMADLVEHLTPRALNAALGEARRVLKPGGRLVIHTMPNLWYYRFGYPLFRFYQRLRGIELPKDPRQRWGFEHLHVNEQTPASLKQALKASGFQAKVWLELGVQDDLGPVSKMVIRGLARLPVLRQTLCNDIYAIGRKPREDRP